MVWMLLLLLLLLEAQAADGLLTPLSVAWCICGSVCLSVGHRLSSYPGQYCRFESVRRTCCEEKDHRERMEEDQRVVIWLSDLTGGRKDERRCPAVIRPVQVRNHKPYKGFIK